MMNMLLFTYLFSLLSPLIAAQAGPNTLSIYNHNRRTMSINGTWLIVPIDKSTAQQVAGYPLVPLPTDDKSLFPKGFPAGKHILIAYTSYNFDIKRGNLEIDSLMGGSFVIPWVDRLGDGKTPFNAVPLGYIGGTNGKELQGEIPAIVGNNFGNKLQNGRFMPDTAAYMTIGPDMYSSQIKDIVIPNPITGPGVVPSALDLTFSTAKKPLYTSHLFHTALNQARILTNGLCQANLIFFNESFANPILRTGTATIYAPPGAPKGLKGVYKGCGGYSANGESVGYTTRNCKAAAKQIPKKATQ